MNQPPLSLYPDFDYQHFWRWTHFADYCYFLVAFSVAGSLVTFLFLGFSLYVELLGFASLLLEACLGLPQLWRNYSNKSTEGMRCQILLVFLIVFGGCCVYSAFVHRNISKTLAFILFPASQPKNACFCSKYIYIPIIVS